MIFVMLLWLASWPIRISRPAWSPNLHFDSTRLPWTRARECRLARWIVALPFPFLFLPPLLLPPSPFTHYMHRIHRALVVGLTPGVLCTTLLSRLECSAVQCNAELGASLPSLAPSSKGPLALVADVTVVTRPSSRLSAPLLEESSAPLQACSLRDERTGLAGGRGRGGGGEEGGPVGRFVAAAHKMLVRGSRPMAWCDRIGPDVWTGWAGLGGVVGGSAVFAGG